MRHEDTSINNQLLIHIFQSKCGKYFEISFIVYDKASEYSALIFQCMVKDVCIGSNPKTYLIFSLYLKVKIKQYLEKLK